MRRPAIIFFLLCIFNLQAQKFGNRSGPEKCWALFHPFAAIKVKKIYSKALPYYAEIKKNNALDSFSNGGKLDAFRHAYFMAAFSQKIKIKKVRKLGQAHEKGNYKAFLKGIKEDGEIPDSLSTVMDLENNEFGLKIGCGRKELDLQQLADVIKKEILNGNAVYMKRNLKGQYLTCQGEIIDLSNYSGKWIIPKCLVRHGDHNFSN